MKGESKDTEEHKPKTLVLFLVSHLGDKWQVATLSLPCAQSCLTLLQPHGLYMGFSRQEYWSGFPFPTPGNLPNPGIKPVSLVSPVLAGRIFFTISTPWEAHSSNGVNNTIILMRITKTMHAEMNG